MMLMQMKLLKLTDDESGFASIIIAMVLILVLSLMTVGFVTLMSREQLSALDKQLSSQAYYAAESGINDATAAINAGYNGNKTFCGPYGQNGDPTVANSNLSVNAANAATEFLAASNSNSVGINNSTAASYTCLLINQDPQFITLNPTVSWPPKVTELVGLLNGNQTQINSININWKAQSYPNNQVKFFSAPTSCDNSPVFPPSGDTTDGVGYTGIVEAEIIPVSYPITRNSLIQDAYTAYLCPSMLGVSSKTYSAGAGGINTGSGDVIDGDCNTTNYCNAQINGLSIARTSIVFVVLQSIYAASTVQLTAYDNNSPANQLDLGGAAVLIDSTGKAQDVLRRVEVESPINANYDIPGGTAAIDSICKDLNVWPSGGTDSCNPTPPGL
jgi:Tfp pilus assembly protein PilX